MKTTLKNISLIAIGAILASTAALYAATIEANINSFTQYIQELFVTSDGTPTGDVVMEVNSDGSFLQTNTATNINITNDNYENRLTNDLIPFAGISHTS